MTLLPAAQGMDERRPLCARSMRSLRHPPAVSHLQSSWEVGAGPMQHQPSCAGSAACGQLDVQADTKTGSFLPLVMLKLLPENVNIPSGIEREQPEDFSFLLQSAGNLRTFSFSFQVRYSARG